MKVAVIGTGYVGLVQAACLADLNNEVVAIDNDSKKIKKLKQGIMPIYEAGLEDLVTRNVTEGRLKFQTEINQINGSEAIFICVGTPPEPNGKPNLDYVENVAKQIGDNLKHYAVIVEKSTVPVRTADWMKLILRNKLASSDFDIAVNPEFLREGTAVKDFYNPDRIVIGTDSEKAVGILTKLYKPLNSQFLHTDMESAELIKHGSNAFLAMKISYANLISRLCEKTGADIQTVMKGIGLDKRIGEDFFKAGIGYGGFCFPKDLGAFVSVLEEYDIDASLLKSVAKINEDQVQYFAGKIVEKLGNPEKYYSLEGKKIAILGLAFKPGTDDMRLAPSIPLIEQLKSYNASISAYDPKAIENAKKIDSLKDIYFAKDSYDAIKNSNAVVIATEWPEFSKLDLSKIKEHTNYIFDGRNIFSPERMKALKFNYYSIGRKPA